MATTPRTSAAGHTLPGAKLKRVTEHIEAHLDQDLTLAHLGAVVPMSPYDFGRRFQPSTGLPPHRFVVFLDVLGVTPEAYRAAAGQEARPRHEGG